MATIRQPSNLAFLDLIVVNAERSARRTGSLGASISTVAVVAPAGSAGDVTVALDPGAI